MKGKNFLLKSRFAEDQCSICGFSECFQSTDHQKIKIQQLEAIISSSMTSNTNLDTLKEKMNRFYEQVQEKILISIHQDRKKTLQWLNTFYFRHLDKSKVNISLICQILQKNHSNLPSRKIIKVVEQLNKKHKVAFHQLNFQGIEENFNNYMAQFQFANIKKNISNYLPYQAIINSSLPFLSTKKLSSSLSIHQQKQDINNFKWKNITLTKKSKELSLSNKQITDQEFIQQVPKLCIYENVKQFQIRNNNITDISCRFIGNNFKFVHTVDLRGNRVGDEGVIYIIRNIPNLKSLMISETNITDLTGYQIVNGMPKLQLLWSQYTKITDQCALKIALKPKLKVFSLAGNKLSVKVKQELKRIFNPKGYVAL